MEDLREFHEGPAGVNEIVIDEPGGSDPGERIRDPDVDDLESFVNLPLFWGDSFIDMSLNKPGSVNVEDETYVFRFKDVLDVTKHMMCVAQRKHFDANVDKTLTNWFRKLFISMNTLFGVDSLVSVDETIDGGISVREFCFRCFCTIRNVYEGDIERGGESVPSDPKLLIWYMAPVKAWLSLIVENVVRIEV